MKPIAVKPPINYCIYASLKPILISIGILIVSLVFQWNLLAYGSVPFLIASLLKYAYLRSMSYTVTNQQIISSAGILSKTENFFELYRVKDFLVRRSLPEQLLGVMTITLITSDSSIKSLQLKGIPKSNLIQTIRNYVQEARETNHVYTFS